MFQEMKLYILKGFFSSLKILVSTTAPSGMTFAKLGATFKLSAVMAIAPVSASLAGLSGWFLDNAVYVNLVAGAIVLDWILGTFKHLLWIKDFHWRENIKGLVVKTFLTVAIGFIVEGLDYLTRDYATIVGALVTILRLTVFLYPAMSVIRSSRVVSEGKFPPQKIYDMIENWTDMIGKKK